MCSERDGYELFQTQRAILLFDRLFNQFTSRRKVQAMSRVYNLVESQLNYLVSKWTEQRFSL